MDKYHVCITSMDLLCLGYIDIKDGLGGLINIIWPCVNSISHTLQSQEKEGLVDHAYSKLFRNNYKTRHGYNRKQRGAPGPTQSRDCIPPVKRCQAINSNLESD